jgi:uncharacterized membrane protein YhhN
MMTPVAWALVGAVGLLLAGHLAAEARGAAFPRAVTKVAASLCFVLLAVTLGVEGSFERGILAGLALSVVGDALLLSDRKPIFLAGLVAFLLAHLAYAVAFAGAGRPALWLVLPIAAIAAAVLRWLWPHLGELRLPVVTYCLAIGTMYWLALGVDRLEVRLGATLFFASDILVARDRFVRRELANRFVGLPLYYAAQVLLALAVR